MVVHISRGAIGLIGIAVCIILTATGIALVSKNKTSSLVTKEPSEEELLLCRGLPCQQLAEVEKLTREINELAAAVHLQNRSRPEAEKSTALREDSPGLGPDRSEPDVGYTMAQTRMMWDIVNRAEASTTRWLHELGAHRRWPLPIQYSILPGTFKASEVKIIHEALGAWQQVTCVRFNKTSTYEHVQPRLEFLNAHMGCFSYVGLWTKKVQILSLDSPQCFKEPGIAVHEVGHAIGLWHQHQRKGRDEYVDITIDDIIKKFRMGYMEWKEYYEDYGLPYDYSSIMHYKAEQGSKTGNPVMYARDQRYQNSMGQRSEITFLDAKAVNFHYCNDTCDTAHLPPLACKHGGYRDPGACDRCRCPDGLGGQLCDELEPTGDEGEEACGGLILLQPGETQHIQTPGHPSTNYPDGLKCNWMVQAPPGHVVALRFVGRFEVDIRSLCRHWVEVKTAASFDRPGQRFCGWDRPADKPVSETRDMVVTFRSSVPAYATRNRGFRAAVTSVRQSGSSNTTFSTGHGQTTTTTATTSTNPTTPTPTNNTTTTTTTSTISTTPTTTTTSTISTTTSTTFSSSTTAKRPTSQDKDLIQYLWECDFEAGGRSTTCLLEQDTDDNIDWRLGDHQLPVVRAGSSWAHRGRYFFYVEGSSPSRPGDIARFFAPDLKYSGDICVDFHYHIYGFHKGRLSLVERFIGSNESSMLWSVEGDKGNKWLHQNLTVPWMPNLQLGFEAQVGRYTSDTAVDSIAVMEGACRS